LVDLSRIAERRVREAIDKGELDGLPGRGLPLPPEQGSALPAELRMAYKILRQHGLVPREVALLKEIDEARRRVEALDGGEGRDLALRHLEALCLEFNTLRPRHVDLEASALGRSEPER
jgi:hypothetical protein